MGRRDPQVERTAVGVVQENDEVMEASHVFREVNRRLAGVLVTLSVAPFLSCGSGTEPVLPAPRAVVLITIDTLRADAVSFTAGGVPTTPFLQGLADAGTSFERAYSPSSWTVPAMASLFTALLPSSHGTTTGEIRRTAGPAGEEHEVVSQPVLPESLETMAEVFARAGYTTIGVPSNLHLSHELGFAQGFDLYGEAGFKPAPVVNRQVEIQLRRAFGGRWRHAWKDGHTFLWVHYFDPHDPYLAREPWYGDYARSLRDPRKWLSALAMRDLHARFPQPSARLAEDLRPLYHSEISFLDHQLGLLDEEIGFTDPGVLTLVTADHGEELVDHGQLGHGHTLYEELVRVPLLVHWPAVLGHGRAQELVSLQDVLPTLCDLLALDCPTVSHGESFAGALGDGPASEERRAVFELDRGVTERALRSGRWKLIRRLEPVPSHSLFDLDTDPDERDDLRDQRSALVARLAAELDSLLDTLPSPPPDTETLPVEDARRLEQLRALGYLGNERSGENADPR